MRTLIFPVLLLASCAANPPVSINTPHGTVRAYSRGTAEEMARYTSLAVNVKATLGSSREELPEVWVVRSKTLQRGSIGTTQETRIEIPENVLRNMPNLPQVLAHEFVHWYVEDSPYAGMPLFVEEGLAEYVSLDLLHMRKAFEKANPTFSFSLQMADFFATGLEQLKCGDEELAGFYLLGYTVVARLGLDGVRDLAVKHSSPLDYLNAARIDLEVTTGDDEPDAEREQ